MTQSLKKTSVKKITLSSSRDIPFDRLSLSQANVRHVKAGVSIEELAEDIARRGLLQGLSVRAVVDEAGHETGMFEIPAGGRRYRALALLVKQKRLVRTAPVPCVVRESGIAEEDSLAENVQRAPLHPLDQFRAFLSLREKGQSEEEIAAAFFISVAVVKQRLRLASVSPKLLEVYAEDGMTLDQLMAFTLSPDHERQEQVFERFTQSYDKSAYGIRRMLTEHAVRATDKRAQFIGVDPYLEAGGAIANDLFQDDGGGWLQDVALVDRLVSERLVAEAEAVRAEGWRWIEVAPSLPYDHAYGLRRLRGEPAALSDDDETARAALQADYDKLEAEYAEVDDLPDQVDERLAEMEAALQAFEDRPLAFDAEDVAIAGAFVSIAGDGRLQVDRGFVRPQDERPIEPPEADGTADEGGDRPIAAADAGIGDRPDLSAEPAEEEDGLTPLSDRLQTELSAHRTLALRQALGERWDVAFLAALHALTLRAFYPYLADSCLELELRSVIFSHQAPGLADTSAARAVTERHAFWAATLPKEAQSLWVVLRGFDGDSRQALFAHCVSLSVNAMSEGWNRRPRALAHADQLAEAVELDMVAAGWRPTVETYLGRVTKARILEAVREAEGQAAADCIAQLKKGDMAEAAQALLAGSGWLPTPLRTLGRPLADPERDQVTEQAKPADADPHAIAAE